MMRKRAELSACRSRELLKLCEEAHIHSVFSLIENGWSLVRP